jgi:hypothetical protein
MFIVGFILLPRMAYIEENIKVRSKPREDSDDEDNSCGSTRGFLQHRWPFGREAHWQLGTYKLLQLMSVVSPNAHWNAWSRLGGWNVWFTCNLISSQLTWLDSTRLKNIEETKKAKQVVAEERHDERKKSSYDEEHLVASRCESSCTQLIWHLPKLA